MTGLNSLKRMTKRPSRRVGRGQSSTRGKQSGRGTKGQNARAGRKKRPEMRDIIKKLPKRRGYGKNRGRTVNATKIRPVAIPLQRLDALFASGAEISRVSLAEKGLIGRTLPPVKIVGGGELVHKLSLKGVTVSASAKVAIEKAGGTII